MAEFFSVLHTVFTGIVLQAVPFLLLGALLSSALFVFVPGTFFLKAFPKKYGLGFVTALFAGALFPICECAAVPLMRSLIKKGVAMPIAVTFMLASPIINPISIISTIYAFPQQPLAALYRVYFGLTIAFATGLVLLLYPESAYLREAVAPVQPDSPSAHRIGTHSGVSTDSTAAAGSMFSTAASDAELQAAFYLATGRGLGGKPGGYAEGIGLVSGANGERTAAQWISAKLSALVMHTSAEFFAAGPFLIIGAFMTALLKAAVPQEFFNTASGSAAGALLSMMLFAFIFSACSTSDAFIARSFLNRFPLGSIFGFLVFGPMMDIKNLFMLLSLFKKRFVIELTLIITVVNFIGMSILTRFFL